MYAFIASRSSKFYSTSMCCMLIEIVALLTEITIELCGFVYTVLRWLKNHCLLSSCFSTLPINSKDVWGNISTVWLIFQRQNNRLYQRTWFAHCTAKVTKAKLKMVSLLKNQRCRQINNFHELYRTFQFLDSTSNLPKIFLCTQCHVDLCWHAHAPKFSWHHHYCWVLSVNRSCSCLRCSSCLAIQPLPVSFLYSQLTTQCAEEDSNWQLYCKSFGNLPWMMDDLEWGL